MFTDANQSQLFRKAQVTASIDTGGTQVRSLIKEQGTALFRNLTEHRLKSFPPTAAKAFRRMSPSETATLLGVTESWLRQTAIAHGEDLTSKGQSRRTYTLEDIQTLRKTLGAKPRSSEKYLPGRRDGEALQIISILNFKGGSAKTTTAANLSQYLALHGYRVLVIDLDPQASLTTMFGVAPEVDVEPDHTIYGAIRYDNEARSIRGIIRRTYIPGLDLVPAGLELMEYEHVTPRMLHERHLPAASIFARIQNAIKEVDADYDLVVIDCPPQLGYLTFGALFAATSVLITVHPQMLDVMSMSQFLTMLGDLLDVIQTNTGAEPNYHWLRYLLTRFESADGPQNQMAGFMRTVFGEHILNHPTYKSTAISDAGLTSQTIYEVERNQFVRATYARALETVNAVNAEIEQLIHRSWGR